MEERIIKFISGHRLMTLATTDGVQPYCCNLFYVFDTASCNLIFMSSSDTRHVKEAFWQPNLAGTIVSDEVSIARLQGIQFTGKFFKPTGELLLNAKKIYFKKFPLAHFLDSSICCIEINFIKMTDNTLGFGKKILWSRATELHAV